MLIKILPHVTKNNSYITSYIDFPGTASVYNDLSNPMDRSKTIYDLRMELFEHIQKLSMSFFDKNPVGRLVTRLTNDIEVLNEMF